VEESTPACLVQDREHGTKPLQQRGEKEKNS